MTEWKVYPAPNTAVNETPRYYEVREMKDNSVVLESIAVTDREEALQMAAALNTTRIAALSAFV